MITEQIRQRIMSISFAERKQREYERYEQQMGYLRSLTENQLHAEYVDTKAKYESKKNMLSLVLVTVILAMFMNVWKYFFQFIKQVLIFSERQSADASGVIEVSFFISIVLAIFLSVVIIGVLMNYMKDLYKIYRYLLMIEKVQESNIQN